MLARSLIELDEGSALEHTRMNELKNGTLISDSLRSTLMLNKFQYTYIIYVIIQPNIASQIQSIPSVSISCTLKRGKYHKYEQTFKGQQLKT
jgi:hypothetical protein